MRQTALSDREAVRAAGRRGRCDRRSRTAHEVDDERASKADSDPGVSNAPEGERDRSTGAPRSGGAELNAGEGFSDTGNVVGWVSEARKFCVVHWKVFAKCRISPRQAHHWTQLIKSS